MRPWRSHQPVESSFDFLPSQASIMVLKKWSFVAICVASFVSVTTLPADDFPTPVNTEKATTTPMDPAEVVKSVKLPPGFELTVVAAEPKVQNPIAMTIDDRGRLWVAENYSWAGGGAGGFDPQQRDRIVILEDTDGDGQHDKRTVFWDDARLLTSIEVGFGGVWAICLPHLVFIPDENRDDVPDSAPRIILDGFQEGIIGHTPANGLKWGPDGWLYGRSGILAPANVGKPGASDSQRFKIDTGVWRYHPTRDVAEAVMHGMTNSWGFDFDEHGEIFVINTVIGHLWHVIPGAHTERMFGLDINPHSYKLLPQVADHVHWDTGESWSDVRKGVTDSTSAAGGGHAHIGLMIYQGDNWPAEYRNRVYTLNLHGMRINSDILQRQGAGYTATHGPDMCFLADHWFRGMELLTGPDGGVFIADWSDTGECHDHDGVHRTSGRIYKLVHEKPAHLPEFDLSKLTSKELIALQSHPNTWWARQSRVILAHRAAQGLSSDELAALRDDLKETLSKTDAEIPRIRLLETIAAVGGTSDSWWIDHLASKNEYERVAVLKFLVDQETWDGRAPSAVLLKTLVELAKTDPSGLVQLHLASSLQKLPVDLRWQVADALAARSEYAHDRMLPLMVWYGIEPAVPRDASRAIALIQVSQMPQLSELVARRLTLEIERNPKSIEQLVELVNSGKCQFPESVISGMSQALNGWQKAAAPEGWTQLADKFAKSESEETRQQVQSLNVIFGDGRAIDEMRAIVTDGSLPPETRRAALRSLLLSKPANYAPTLLELVGDQNLRVEALRGLSQYDEKEIPEKILSMAGGFKPAERSEMILTLTSRPASAKALLAAVRAGHVQPSELSAFHARQIASFENEELTKELTELWGDVRVSAAEKRVLVDNYKSQLTTDVLAHANLSAGRAIFQKSCANCHVLFGAGRRLGPDITGSNRKNLDYLLENIIDPSASVGASFRTVVVVLDDGRVINGVISELNERTLTLQSAQETLTLDRQQIDEMKTTAVSLMPEGQLQNLSPEQVRDLIGYLMSSEQVPLPADEGK
ncbi:PVC-type heme-binding CxxCH protein [Planctomicrobium sp. SH661]|uniref:PVC-type heme-binding CxxCH protein n=1 Tax=Planctomicrobium sp. SH661 TaxID=3448124 RepID=UPI003F5B282C